MAKRTNGARASALTLRELRSYAGATQTELAQTVAMTQPELSRLERREDFLLSSLKRYVEALGGSVELRVVLGSSSFRVVDAAQTEPHPTPSEIEDAITGLSNLREWLPPLVEGLSLRQLRSRQSGCGTFSLLEHLWHLRDLEAEAFTVRIAAMLERDCPAMEDFDGDAAATARVYNAQAVEPALAELLAARQKNVVRLRKLGPSKLNRRGHLATVGSLSVGRLIVRWRGHDLGHRIEMERLQGVLSGTPTTP